MNKKSVFNDGEVLKPRRRFALPPQYFSLFLKKMMSFHQLVWLILLNLTKNRIKNTTATTANKRPNRKDPKPENMHHVLTAAAASALAVANAQIDKSPQRIAPIKKTITMGNESSPTFCLLKRFNKFIFFFTEMCVTVVFATV